MGVLTAICVDVKDAPADVKIRHVPVVTGATESRR